ncbi:Uncharacterised protein [uncultured archaeon]|nr:Uncharacterised protein [uncultured archaeon]
MNSRGFLGIVLVLGMIAAAAILLSTTYEVKNSYSFKEVLPQIKTYTSTYETTLNIMAHDYNLRPSEVVPLEWVDANASALLARKDLTYLNCTKQPPYYPSGGSDLNYVKMDFNCSAIITKGDEVLSIGFLKTMIIRKN